MSTIAIQPVIDKIQLLAIRRDDVCSNQVFTIEADNSTFTVTVTREVPGGDLSVIVQDKFGERHTTIIVDHDDVVNFQNVLVDLWLLEPEECGIIVKPKTQPLPMYMADYPEMLAHCNKYEIDRIRSAFFGDIYSLTHQIDIRIKDGTTIQRSVYISVVGIRISIEIDECVILRLRRVGEDDSLGTISIRPDGVVATADNGTVMFRTNEQLSFKVLVCAILSLGVVVK